MSAESIARLREDCARAGRGVGVIVDTADLRALLHAYETVYARGVADERARVVADLRAMMRTFKTPATEQWRDALEWASARYERGEHEEGK